MTDLILRSPCLSCDGLGHDGTSLIPSDRACSECGGSGGTETVLDPTTVLLCVQHESTAFPGQDYCDREAWRRASGKFAGGACILEELHVIHALQGDET